MQQAPAPSMVSLWMEGWATALRIAETMVAANVMIESRLASLPRAAQDPLAVDQVALAGAMFETLESLARTGAWLLRDLQAVNEELLAAAVAAAGGTQAVRSDDAAPARRPAPLSPAAKPDARRSGKPRQRIKL